MSIRYEPQGLPDHLRLDCTGDFSAAEAIRVIGEGFGLAVKGGHGALLVDARNVGGREPTLTERYELAVRIAEIQSVQQPRIRLAILGHEPLIHRERFGEIVATNRGAVARVFTEEAAAVDWLLGTTRKP